MKIKYLILLTILLSGCASFSLPKSAPNPPEKLYEFNQVESIRPKIVGQIDGNPIVAYETEKVFSSRQAVSESKLTFGQRVGRFIGGLSLSAFLFIIISLLFFGGAPIIWAVKKYFKLRNAFKNTVKGIRDLPPTVYEEATDTLAKTQNQEDKKLVDKIKSELH